MVGTSYVWGATMGMCLGRSFVLGHGHVANITNGAVKQPKKVIAWSNGLAILYNHQNMDVTNR